MANLSSPIGQTIDVASRTISRSVIAGGGGGRGGNVEPQTSAIVKRQAGEIVQLKKEINTIQKAQTTAVQTYQSTISSISNILNVIAVNVRDLGGRVLGVNNLLSQDANLEAKKDRQELDQERKLAEQGARAGKEKALERKIQNALMAPVRMVTAKTQGMFERLMKAFTLFFLGWLSNKVIAALQDQSGKTTNLFKRIFDSIIGGVTFFLKSLQFINKSIRGIIGIVTGVTKLLAKFLVSTLGALFKGLAKLGEGIVNAGKSIVTAGKGLLGIGDNAAGKAVKETGEAAAEGAGKLALREGTEAAGKLAAKEGTEAGLKGVLKKIPGVSFFAGLGFGAARLYQGDSLGAAGELASGILGSFPGLGTAGSLAIDAALLGRDINRGLQENKDTKGEQSRPMAAPSAAPATTASPAAVKAQPSPAAVQPLSPAVPPPAATPSPTPAAQPATTATPSMADFQFSADTSGKMGSEMDFTLPAESGEISAPVTTGNVSPDQKSQAQITPAQTQRVPTAATKVGPEPEQKPNIIMMSSMTPPSQGSSTLLKSSPSGSASDVPAISSSNPSNFYTLYSQVNYNVVV